MSKTKSPWGIQHPTETLNLEEIMSEQLANDLQIKEDSNKLLLEFAEPVEIVSNERGCENDFLLAQMLQLQFDNEFEDGSSLEKNASKSCKKSIQDNNELEDYTFESDYYDINSDNRYQNFSKSGYGKESGEIITKHDLRISARRNGSRILDLSPGVQVGNDDCMNIHLSNTVFNSLKTFGHRENQRRHRLRDKSDQATAGMSFDAKTKLLLFKLINKGILDRINGTVSTGKESVVLHANGGTGSDHLVPRECAIKVYKTTLNEFKTRGKYVQGDFRFKDKFSKLNPRNVIHLWAEKECHNLIQMHKVGILCPEVVILKKHMLVMSFLGEDHVPARQLKETELSACELAIAYEDCITTMKKLYCEAHLVHADLSEYNILWHNGHCWFIDVSQAIDRNHPRALEFLFRDCNNICNFFTNRGLPKVMSPDELFKEVCDVSISDVGPSVLDQINDYEKNLEMLTCGTSVKEYQFNYCWENSVDET